MRIKIGICVILVILTVSIVSGQTMFDDHSLLVPSLVDYGPANLIFHEDLIKSGLSKHSLRLFEPFYFRFGELPSSWQNNLQGYTFVQKYLSKKAKLSENEKRIISQNIQLPKKWTDRQKTEFRSKLFSSKSISKSLRYNILIIFDINDLQSKIEEAVKAGDLLSTEIKVEGKMLYIIKGISTRDRKSGLYCIHANESRLIASNSKKLIIRSLAAGKGEINSFVVDQEFKEVKDKLTNNCFRWRIDRMPYAMLNKLNDLKAENKDDASSIRKLRNLKEDIENGMHWSVESYLVSGEKIEKRTKYYFGSEGGAKKYYHRVMQAKASLGETKENAHLVADTIRLDKEILEVVTIYDDRKLDSHKKWYQKTRSRLIELRKQELANDK